MRRGVEQGDAEEGERSGEIGSTRAVDDKPEIARACRGFFCTRTRCQRALPKGPIPTGVLIFNVALQSRSGIGKQGRARAGRRDGRFGVDGCGDS